MPGEVMNVIGRAAATAALLLMVACGAKKPMAITLIVTTPDGKPVPTAYIQHPEAVERFHANPDDGRWSGTQVILANGTVVPFLTQAEVPFQVSAPGYVTELVKVTPVARGTNEFPVVLQPDVTTPVDPASVPSVKFGTDDVLDK